MRVVTTIQRYAAPLATGLVAVALLLSGDVLSAGVLGLLTVAVAWWVSPFHAHGGPGHATVAADPDAYPVVIYWRPGCLFCTRLKGALGRRKHRATWVSIWADRQAAAYVRSINGGNETVPTVVVDGTAYTNPDPALVKQALPAA